MTYWFTAYCNRCKCESPPILLTFNSKLSLYALDDDAVRKGGEWMDEHGWHEPVILHEDHEMHATQD